MLPLSCLFGEPKSPVASDEPLDSGFFDEPKSPALSKGPLGSSFEVVPKSPGPLSLNISEICQIGQHLQYVLTEALETNGDRCVSAGPGKGVWVGATIPRSYYRVLQRGQIQWIKEYESSLVS